jgi:hypothetical protein
VLFDGNISLFLRIAELGIALDLCCRILEILLELLPTLIAKINQCLGPRGDLVPLLEVTLVAERLQVKDGVLSIEGTRNDVVEVANQLLAVDISTA